MNQRLIDNMAQFYSPGRRVTTRQTISVTVTDLDAFGQGVARHKGKAIFIPGLLPEEQAEVVITEDKRQFSKGKIKKLLIRSPQRVVPRCPHFSTCGGCQQQHASEALQHLSPRDFIQVNDPVSKQMVRQAVQWLDIQPDERVLDLFCGMGNFTLPLAKCAKEVVGVEGVTTLVANAQYNARINLVNNVSFFHANLEDETTWQQWATQGFEKVLLDPARAGAPGVMPHIATLAPKRVVYVSCNPATLARDSKILLEAGYRLAQLRMLDMFPHTGHLESMALFINQSEE